MKGYSKLYNTTNMKMGDNLVLKLTLSLSILILYSIYSTHKKKFDSFCF